RRLRAEVEEVRMRSTPDPRGLALAVGVRDGPRTYQSSTFGPQRRPPMIQVLRLTGQVLRRIAAQILLAVERSIPHDSQTASGDLLRGWGNRRIGSGPL